MPFDPRQYLVSLDGREYLPVAARLMWLNADAKRFTIHTEFLTLHDTYAIARATVTLLDDEGRPIRAATGTKREDRADFSDFEAKAETGAIGRALGMLGFGTQFAPEFDELAAKETPRVVDAPQPPRHTEPAAPPSTTEAPSTAEAETPPAAHPALNVPGLTTAARLGAPTNKRKPAPDPAPSEPEPHDAHTELDSDQDTDHVGGEEYDHTSVADEDLFSEAKVRRLLSIAGKLFNLKGDALEARLAGAATKILGRTVFDIHALHWRDGNEVMRALEEQAVKRGLWDAAKSS